MIVTLEGFVRKILSGYNPPEWMARLLNLPKAKDASASPGLVMIQIDGLSFNQAQRAIKEGNMPFLARLLKKEDYRLLRHYSGVPSNTPAVQGVLFYGVKACVPAFCFRDSLSGEVFNMFNPASAAAVENRIKDQGEPLLKGGSAYGNIFTGGAQEPHFCASSTGWGSLLIATNHFRVLFTLLLNFHVFVRAFFLILIELVLALFDFFHGLLTGKNFVAEMRFIPMRVAVCILFREVVATGARIDIARGLPVIHLNLAGYDEQAHHRGPTSTFAHWSLRGIDSAIAKIWQSAQNSKERLYEVFIYSDHGQEDTVDYREVFGRTMEEAVNQVLEQRVASDQWQTEYGPPMPNWRSHMFVNAHPNKQESGKKEEKSHDPHAFISAMGAVSHVYLPKNLPIEEKETIVRRLITLAKIPIVMMAGEAGQAWAWTPEGKFTFPDEADQVLEETHPFLKEVARDLVVLCHHPDSGDLIMFGWKKGPRSLTFHAEQGSHAGPGPEETSGFAALPKSLLPQPLTKTIDTQDLRYAAFRAQGRSPSTGSGVYQTALDRVNGPLTLRIMTYNVHGCMGLDGLRSPSRIASIIARHDPDVVALQEMDTTHQGHQAEMIAQKLAMEFHFHPSLSMKKGKRGNAIISKFPLRLVRSGGLPKLPRSPYLESRGALWVEIDWKGVKVQVFNTHLSLLSREGVLQMKALCGSDWVGSPTCFGPIVFCGDLNAAPNSKICKQLGQVLKNTHFDLSGHRPLKTLPSFYPLRLIDHIFVGGGLVTTKIEVPCTRLEKISSDHLPLIVDVQIL